MGLLYCDGIRLHDDATDAIEAARERRSRYLPPAATGDGIEARYTQRETLQSLSADVRAAARARASQAAN